MDRTLGLLNNLTMVLKRQNKLAEALPLFEELNESTLRVYGAERRLTLRSKASPASLHQAAGRLDKAESMHRGTLEAQRRILGDKDPDVLESSHNFASLLKARGSFGEATAVARRSLDAHRTVYGADSPYVAMSEGLLADILITSDDATETLTESAQLATHALAVLDAKLPPTHPSIMGTLKLLDRLHGESKLNDAGKRSAIQARLARRTTTSNPD